MYISLKLYKKIKHIFFTIIILISIILFIYTLYLYYSKKDFASFQFENFERNLTLKKHQEKHLQFKQYDTTYALTLSTKTNIDSFYKTRKNPIGIKLKNLIINSDEKKEYLYRHSYDDSFSDSVYYYKNEKYYLKFLIRPSDYNHLKQSLLTFEGNTNCLENYVLITYYFGMSDYSEKFCIPIDAIIVQ